MWEVCLSSFIWRYRNSPEADQLLNLTQYCFPKRLKFRFILYVQKSWATWAGIYYSFLDLQLFCSLSRQLFVDGFSLLSKSVSYRNHINKMGASIDHVTKYLHWNSGVGIFSLPYTFHINVPLKSFCCFTLCAFTIVLRNSVATWILCAVKDFLFYHHWRLCCEHFLNKPFLLSLTKKIFIKNSPWSDLMCLLNFINHERNSTINKNDFSI